MKKSIQILLFIATVLLAFEAKGQQNTAKSPDVVNSFDRKFFIENRGQWHSDVLYLCRMGGLDAWITKYGVNYTFFKLEKAQPFSPLRKYDEHGHLPDKFEHQDYSLIGHRVLMKLQAHNPEPVREGKQRQEGYYNYFIGNDEAKHATYVGLYKEAIVKSVYEGIDLRYYFDNGNLRYDYIVHPYADPSRIVFTLEGSDKTYINSKGNLVFTTRFGEVAMAELKTYQAQDKKEVKSRFVQRNGKWGIDLANYDKTQVLIIDPLVYSTYIGGSDNDYGYDIAVDGSGSAYVTGVTWSTDYDFTAGAFQTTYGGYYDVFVTKLNATGTALVYSTYIGGSFQDEGHGIAVDGSGSAYVTGYTYSSDYDTTAGAFQTTHGGGYQDVFVTKLNATGTALVYSTYIGGSSDDNGNGIAVDGSGSAYVTGQTSSSNYDVTAGAFQTTHGGGIWDVFVTKLWPGALPIQSITLTGQANSNYNSLQWQVETNELLKAYTLQRYHHATKEWQEVATLLHQSGQSIYVYQDKSYPVKENTLLYRVQGRGKDGGSLYSNVIEITPVREEVWSVYPNPNRGNFTLQNAPLGVYEVIEPTGKVIHWFEVQNTSTEVQLALPAGMYFIRERRTGAMGKFVVW